ncbi:MAG: hypothetical protein ACQETI_10255 [Halobacteriota archaeon]
MIDELYRSTLLALYQLTIALGIMLMPVALLSRRLGVPLRFDRVLHAVDGAYENATSR